MSPVTRWCWGVGLILLAALVVWSLLRGSLSLISLWILLVASSVALYQLWRPWAGARRWYRVRYHTAAPPDPALLPECLLALLDQGAIVLRWVREARGLSLWLEVPAARAALLGPVLDLVLPDLHLESVPPPMLPKTVPIAAAALARAGTGHPADPLAVPLWRQALAADPPAEIRLVLFTSQTAALLSLGTAPASAPFRPLRWLPVGGRRARLRAWLLEHYPWGDRWPERTLPPLDWPATATLDTVPLDTAASYDVPPTAPLPAVAVPYLELGISSTTGAPIRVSANREDGKVPTIWQGHFLSLGTGPQRLGPLARLAEQTHAQGTALFALDPHQRLLPALQGVLLDPAVRPAWITRQHPRSSLRLNLLAVPPTPGPDRAPEVGALHLALTSALPLFEHFLARLGLTPWSTQTGGVLIRDLALGLLLQHHRVRLTGDPPPPVPTPAALYGHLQAGTDIRSLLTTELLAWTSPSPALARACGASAVTTETYTLACTQIAISARRWADAPLTTQHDARDSIRALLQPLFEAPGFGPLWQAPTPPSEYFNSRTTSLTLTQLLPPDPTERDRILANWYGEYLLLAVIAAAQARRFAEVSGPPVLVLLDRLRAWSLGILQPAHLETLGATGISCAATDTHLPAAPDGEQILRSFGTWWLHTLVATDQAAVAPYLAAILPTAGDLPLVYFPPDLALLRTTIPASWLATVTVPPPGDQAASAEAA